LDAESPDHLVEVAPGSVVKVGVPVGQDVSDTVVKVSATVSIKVDGVLSSTILACISIALPPASAITIMEDEIELQAKLSTLLHELVNSVEDVILVEADLFLFYVRDIGGGGPLVSLSDVNHKDTDDTNVRVRQRSQMGSAIRVGQTPNEVRVDARPIVRRMDGL